MRRVDNYCVGCPQGCINCGRKHVSHYVCDGYKCDADTIDGETILYADGDKHYCLKCLIENNKADFVEYMTYMYGEEWASENFAEVGDD